MNTKMFKELVESIIEARKINSGEQKPSRIFKYGPLDFKARSYTCRKSFALIIKL